MKADEIALKLMAVPAALNVVAQLRLKSHVGLLRDFVQSISLRKKKVKMGTSDPSTVLAMITTEVIRF